MALPTKVGLRRPLGKPGPGHDRALARGRSRATQLICRARLQKHLLGIDRLRALQSRQGIPSLDITRPAALHLALRSNLRTLRQSPLNGGPVPRADP